ncbi:vpr protein [Simian immunodeficiency virus]|uniref:Protein Vpr n=1 Tax=Simian immunodeficiency virus TaxID=11723 RepID=V5T9S9_SIV|nr:vpr protein [Simian immunodeficiency virus]
MSEQAPKRPREGVPEDETVERDFNWLQEQVELITQEARRHFPLTHISVIMMGCVRRHWPDQWAAAIAYVRILESALYLHIHAGQCKFPSRTNAP